MNGVRAVMRTGKTVAEQQSLALAAAENLPMKTCGIASHRPARRQVDPQRHEHFDPL